MIYSHHDALVQQFFEWLTEPQYCFQHVKCTIPACFTVENQFCCGHFHSNTNLLIQIKAIWAKREILPLFRNTLRFTDLSNLKLENCPKKTRGCIFCVVLSERISSIQYKCQMLWCSNNVKVFLFIIEQRKYCFQKTPT